MVVAPSCWNFSLSHSRFVTGFRARSVGFETSSIFLLSLWIPQEGGGKASIRSHNDFSSKLVCVFGVYDACYRMLVLLKNETVLQVAAVAFVSSGFGSESHSE